MSNKTESVTSNQLYDITSIIPQDWSLTPIYAKFPFLKKWSKQEKITNDQLKHYLTTPQWIPEVSDKEGKKLPTGIGLRLGDYSNGVIAIDIDGKEAKEILKLIFFEATNGEQNCADEDTVRLTSGRPNRECYLFQIPEQYREKFAGIRKIDFSNFGKVACPDKEELAFRYNNMAMCLPPSIHPKTKAPYSWINSPEDTELKELHPFVCDLLLERHAKNQEAKNQGHNRAKSSKLKSDKAVSLLDFLSKPNLRALKEGAKYNSRDNTGFALACDLVALEGFFEDKGIPVQEDSLDLMLEYVINCEQPEGDPFDETDANRLHLSAQGDFRKPAIGYRAVNERLSSLYDGYYNSHHLGTYQQELLERECINLLETIRSEDKKYLKIFELAQEYNIYPQNLEKYLVLLDQARIKRDEYCLFAKDMFLAHKKARRRLPMGEILPAPLASAIDALANNMGCNPESLFTNLLPAWASVIGGQVDIAVKSSSGYVQPSIIRAINVADSGSNKSGVLQAATAWIQDLEIKAANDYGNAEQLYKETKHEYDKQPKSQRGLPPEKPIQKRYFASDKTMEALYHTLHKNQQLEKQGFLIAKDEYSGEFRSFNKYAKAGDDVESDLQLFSSTMIRKDRKTDDYSILIKKPCVSKTGSTQWNTLADIMQEIATDDSRGYLCRYLYCCLPSERQPIDLFEENIDPRLAEVRDRYKHIMRNLGFYLDNDLPQYTQLVLSYDAKHVFQSWQHQSLILAKYAKLKQFKIAIPKFESYLSRIALVLHTLESYFTDGDFSPEVSGETMQKAVEVVEFYMQQYQNLIYRNSPHLGIVLDVLDLVNQKKAVTIAQMINYSSKMKKIGRRELNQICDLLVASNKIVRLTSNKTTTKFGSLAAYGDSDQIDTESELSPLLADIKERSGIVEQMIDSGYDLDVPTAHQLREDQEFMIESCKDFISRDRLIASFRKLTENGFKGFTGDPNHDAALIPLNDTDFSAYEELFDDDPDGEFDALECVNVPEFIQVIFADENQKYFEHRKLEAQPYEEYKDQAIKERKAQIAEETKKRAAVNPLGAKDLYNDVSVFFTGDSAFASQVTNEDSDEDDFIFKKVDESDEDLINE